MGGRKSDVSALFNAETGIIGFASGLFGVIVTYLLELILNSIISALFGIAMIADLTIPTALIIILISIGLTAISGLMPASSAASKDPVVALRTE
jgi:putative ABC transport system permease protein